MPNLPNDTRAQRKRFGVLAREWPLLISITTAALFLLFGQRWLADLASPIWFTFILGWLFGVILLSSFAVVRHAESLAVRLGEPLGTLVLTLAVTGIEVAMIAAAMFTGGGNPALARDAMFAVVMIVLNGMVGLSLLLGGLRHHEQTYNLQGANAFLAMILPLAVLGLVLPNFTTSSPGPTFSPRQATFLIVMSISLYGIFLAVQNVRHRHYFIASGSADGSTDGDDAEHHGDLEVRSNSYHAGLLVTYFVPVVILSKQIAIPVDYGIHVLGAPKTLGGFLVATLVLSPESLAATRAALANQLQRSVNILLGSVLATIGLTIPAVLAIGLTTGKPIILGLNAVDTTLLSLTLVLSTLTFTVSRTNVLLGAVHLLMFAAYVMLIFEK
jgi:Ca2+:H+ antiporter